MQILAGKMTAGIMIAAAGRGARCSQAGDEGNKLNAKFVEQSGRQRSLWEQTLRQSLASGLPVWGVTRADKLQVRQVGFAYVESVMPLTSAGLVGCIAGGVNATPHWQGWLTHLAAMPFVPPRVVQQQPAYPVGFCKQRARWRGNNGVRAPLIGQTVYLFTLDQPTLGQNIDLASQLPASE